MVSSRCVPLLQLAGLVAVALACGPASPIVSQEELLERLESGSPPLLLDVRTPAEFASGHVPGALNVPHTELADRLAELEPDDEVVVYCESGRRAQVASSLLEARGFSAVRHLDGDMSAWRRAELPCTGC